MTTGDVWITGARGFIGRHLAAQLAGSGRRVVGLGHGAWPDAGRWGIARWLNGDIAPDNLGQLAHDEGRPAAVFHLAGGSSVGAAIAAPREDFKRTVEATAALCDWLRLESPESRLLAVSSAAVYGASHDGPIAEAAAGRPYSPYGYHKLMMEQVCRAYAETYGLSVVIARLFSVYGPELRKQLLWDACQRLAAGTAVLELGGSGTELRDWTDIADVVRALEMLSDLASPEAPAINVGTGRGLDVAAIADLVVTAWGEGTAVRFSGQGRPGDPQSLVADARRLQALGFRFDVSAERGVAAYVAWHRSQASGPAAGA
ncbi:MAG: SDR family oxidoreductase [Alphaproteobacteria bacterium]|nr:SDR family oxidoreductase [Alphaproteobacteria bacterium]MBU1525485.1 SDR family oxidoreductase [Alphaproteobacteria bacterium]MBU2350887.1 SDR family oxidoreductase [Alphaproteobacteria bacterium]MBU2381732.1 SDR family oxidoreductase [Alphaproteobacteria bacterium]